MPGFARVETLPDAQLVERVLHGDQELYAVLVRRHQEMLYRHAFWAVHDADVAADLTQDSLVKAYTSLATCEDPSRFSAWVYRILRNRCMDYLKSSRRRDIPLDLAPEMTTGETDAERAIEKAELQDAIARALAALPEGQREAFVLKHVEDLSYEEMSERLGVGVSALKMRVMRAREALQAALAEQHAVV